MRFKHKELFIGVFVGAVVFGGFSILADNAYEIVKNPYKVTVNGTEKPIEGYNIDGNTYFKLRDIGEQVGFDVDFKEETIMINVKDVGDSLPLTTNDSISGYNYTLIDNTEYISAKDVDDIVFNSPFSNSSYLWTFAYSTDKNGTWSDENGSWGYLCKLDCDNGNKQLEEYKIPCHFINGTFYLSKDVFESEILARVRQ